MRDQKIEFLKGRNIPNVNHPFVVWWNRISLLFIYFTVGILTYINSHLTVSEFAHEFWPFYLVAILLTVLMLKTIR